ncbi:hypothetical protein HDE_06407 [Halotydeus destructor]|nr:hypothetical protein HDE_06407 [Halotydeus destructor]
MFFGMNLKGPNGLINLKPDEGFHLNNVALEPMEQRSTSSDTQYVSFYIVKDGQEHLICTLDENHVNHHVGLSFDGDDTISLMVKGNGTLHFTGYYEDEEDLSGSEVESNVSLLAGVQNKLKV